MPANKITPICIYFTSFVIFLNWLFENGTVFSNPNSFDSKLFDMVGVGVRKEECCESVLGR